MPKMSEEIILSCSRDEAFSKMGNLNFEQEMMPFGFEVLFQNDRVIRYQWKSELDSPGFEKILIPENYTILVQRKPKAPFLYSYFFYLFTEHKKGALLKYIQDFELDDENKYKEADLLSYMKGNNSQILQRIEKYFKP